MSKTIGIMVHGQLGDIMTAMSVIRYREELWDKDCKIIWWASKENWDVFKHQDIEVREFPRGFGYHEMVVEENRKLIELGKEPIWEDWQPIVDWDNKMNVALKHEYPSLADIDIGYFPAPHQVPISKRQGVEYPEVSKIVFGVPMEYEWHPVLKFSEQEIQSVNEFIDGMFFFNKTVCIESFGGSGQSSMNDENIHYAMRMCRSAFGECNFIFMSHKYIRAQEEFPKGLFEQNGVYSASDFTVRECALIVGNSDLLISVSSGISVASSCWGNNPTPIIQFCGSAICSTKKLALGRFELATNKNEFYDKLNNLLNDLK